MGNESVVEIRSLDALHSNEIREIVTVVPNWILRWGISMVFCLLMLMVMGTAFVDYPDTVNADLKIRMFSQQRPVEIPRTGEKSLSIVSLRNSYFGEIYIPQEKLAKVRVGQNILVELKGYPSQQFGFLRGKIASLSDIPQKDSMYIGKVSLGTLQGAKAGKQVPIRDGMVAKAKIIIEQTSLLKRLIKSLTRAFGNA